MIKVGFKKLTDDAILPTKAHATDSGFDLFANEDVVIGPGETKLVKTGIAVHLPDCYEAQVRPRSGITSKTKLRVQLGTIDNDYTGEIGIIVDNISTDTWSNAPRLIDNTYDDSLRNHAKGYRIRKGDRIAQLVIQALPMVDAYEVDELQKTARGSNGFGSSGY